MTPQQAINDLEKTLSAVKTDINKVIRALKEISSEEVLNGSITEAQKILAQIVPVDESSKKVFKIHDDFLKVLENLEIKNISIPATRNVEKVPAPEEKKVSFEDVATQMDDLIEEEITEKPDEKLPSKKEATSNKDYRLLILKALIYLGGSAKIEEIFNFIERDMKSKFKPYDLEQLSEDKIKRWQNSVKEERTTMVEEELLSTDSINGTWEIVQKGIDYLSNQNK